MRIYCYKDTNAWFLNFLLEQDGVRRFPSGHEYAVRHKCSTELTAKGFCELTEQKPVDDDGLRPYCFVVHEYGVNLLAYFDRDSAHKNKLDRPDLEKLDTDF